MMGLVRTLLIVTGTVVVGMIAYNLFGVAGAVVVGIVGVLVMTAR